MSSFPQYDVEYVTKLLAIFEKEGLITRIAKGVYVKAQKTRFGILYPSAYELVKEIAKRDKAKVIPTGATAANRLGFSTQVPMNSVFLTTGSGRKLKLGNRKDIQIVPDQALMSAYENDYKEMQESFIYGESLPFDKLMERIKSLQVRFRSIDGQLNGVSQ